MTRTIAVSFLCAALIGCGPPRSPSSGGQELTAFVMCQAPVQSQLKAPSTAIFPNFSAQGVSSRHVGNGKYTVIGFVDAQNGFGAQIRATWICEIKENSDKTWSTLNVKIRN